MRPRTSASLYLVLVVGTIVAGVLVQRGDRRGWVIGAALSAGPMVAYILSRSTGLPNSKQDVGSWLEPIGLIALAAEAVFITLAARALRTERTQ